MKRIYPSRIGDKYVLSRLLEQYLSWLEHSPLQMSTPALSWGMGVPVSIFRRLARLHHHPEDAANIQAEDYHILFANILFRCPTVKIWASGAGVWHFEV